MKFYTGTSWKRHLGLGLFACLIYPTIAMGIDIPEWRCFPAINCQGQRIVGYTSCGACPSSQAIRCKSCCLFRSHGHIIQTIQTCPPPNQSQVRAR